MNKVHLNFDWTSVELINKLNQNNKSNLENGVIDLWALELRARTQQLDTVDSSIDRENRKKHCQKFKNRSKKS